MSTIATNLIRRRTVAVAAVVAAGFAASAPHADALVVGSGANGLELREPDNILDRVKVSLVSDAGALKYRVEMPRFGGRGLSGGAGCLKVTPDEFLCQRLKAQVKVSLGFFRDSFSVPATFPDPIEYRGSLEFDTVQLGAGDDTAFGNGDRVHAGGGNDRLIADGSDVEVMLGEDGNDFLQAFRDRDRLDGGNGNDELTAKADQGRNTIGKAELSGGPGVDTFQGNGNVVKIDSRDGIAETVACGFAASDPRHARRRGAAVVDLVDKPSDAALLAGGCKFVDRAPKGEKTAAQIKSTKLSLRRGIASITVKCTTKKRCKGKLSLSVKSGKASKRYSIKGRRSQRISVRLRGGSKLATVRLKEKGKKGSRTQLARLAVKR